MVRQSLPWVHRELTAQAGHSGPPQSRSDSWPLTRMSLHELLDATHVQSRHVFERHSESWVQGSPSSHVSSCWQVGGAEVSSSLVGASLVTVSLEGSEVTGAADDAVS